VIQVNRDRGAEGEADFRKRGLAVGASRVVEPLKAKIGSCERHGVETVQKSTPEVIAA
jgi:hypothetical protein